MARSQVKTISPLQLVIPLPKDETLLRLERGLRQHGYSFQSKWIDDTVIQFEIQRNSSNLWLIATGTLQDWTSSDQTRVTCQVRNATVNNSYTASEPLIKLLVYLGSIGVVIFPIIGMVMPDSNLFFFMLTLVGWTLLFALLGNRSRTNVNMLMNSKVGKTIGLPAGTETVAPPRKLISEFYDEIAKILSEERPPIEVQMSSQMP